MMKIKYVYYFLAFLFLACKENAVNVNKVTFDSVAKKKGADLFISKEEIELLIHPEKDSFYKEFGGEYNAYVDIGTLKNLPASLFINQLKECSFTYVVIYPNGAPETVREFGTLVFKSASGNEEYYSFSNRSSNYDVTLMKRGDSRYIKIDGYQWRLNGKLKSDWENSQIGNEQRSTDNNIKNDILDKRDHSYFPFDGNPDELSGKEGFSEISGLNPGVDRHGNAAGAFRFENNPNEVRDYLKQTNFKRRSNYSISIWFYPTKMYPKESGTNYFYQAIIGVYPKSYDYGPAFSLSLKHADNSILIASHWTEKNRLQSVASKSGTIILNKWYHAIMMYDGRYLYLYLNSKLIDKKEVELSYNNQTQLLVGGAGDGPDPGGIYGGFNGFLDDFRIYDRMLSDKEIDALYKE